MLFVEPAQAATFLLLDRPGHAAYSFGRELAAPAAPMGGNGMANLPDGDRGGCNEIRQITRA
jgi:hypothetical protein